MENRKLIYFFGLLFSAIFALLYYGLFHILIQDSPTYGNVYYNQVGLYKNEENAQKVVQQLNDLKIDAHIFLQAELHAVICGISEDQALTQENGAQLAKEGMNYIEKQWTGNEAILNALQENDIEKVLEMIQNESQRNESAGATP